jgi:hypothetical protein
MTKYNLKTEIPNNHWIYYKFNGFDGKKSTGNKITSLPRQKAIDLIINELGLESLPELARYTQINLDSLKSFYYGNRKSQKIFNKLLKNLDMRQNQDNEILFSDLPDIEEPEIGYLIQRNLL